MSHGNQHASRYGTLMGRLHNARQFLADGYLNLARINLEEWRREHAQAPASTRRRWRCGK